MANFFPIESLPDDLGEPVDVEGAFRHHDGVGTARHARVQGDPSGVAAHQFDDHDALMRLGGGLEPVQCLGRHRHRRVETEGDIGAGDVVVDGLGHADDRQAGLAEQPSRLEGALAADRDDGVDAEVRAAPRGQFRAAAQLARLYTGRAQDRAAQGQDSADRVEGQRAVVTVQQAAPAVFEADDLVAVIGDTAVDDGSDHGIEAGAVTATGQHAYTHRSRLQIRPGGRRRAECLR